LPRVRGTAMGSWRWQYFPLLYIESFVPQPGSRQVRSFPKERRSLTAAEGVSSHGSLTHRYLSTSAGVSVFPIYTVRPSVRDGP